MTQELKDKQELEKTGKIGDKQPVDIIREMNPGAHIPTGAELAQRIKDREADQ